MRRASLAAASAATARIVHGDLAHLRNRDHVAILAEYSPRPYLSRAVIHYVDALNCAGFAVLVVAARDRRDSFAASGVGEATTVVVRDNSGYDFGSWATGLHLAPFIAAAAHVVLTNDSIVGPFVDMAPFLAEAADSGADVYAATANRQIAPHLQSYLLGFTRGVLADRPLARFFRSIGPAPSKMDYVRRYEVGLSTLLRNEGYGTYVKWLSPGWEREADNRSLKDWRQLLDEGFPFIKKMLLTGEDADNIAREIDARFGILVKEWL